MRRGPCSSEAQQEAAQPPPAGLGELQSAAQQKWGQGDLRVGDQRAPVWREGHLCQGSQGLLPAPLPPTALWPPEANSSAPCVCVCVSVCVCVCWLCRQPALRVQDRDRWQPRADLRPGVHGRPHQAGLLLLPVRVEAEARELRECAVAADQLHLPAGLGGHRAGLPDLRLPVVSVRTPS